MPCFPNPPQTGSMIVTILYTTLLLWGMFVGVRQVYQGFFRPQDLLNPLFGNRLAIKIFTFHLAVVSADLFICGPIALHYKSTLWYWGGRVALMSSSFSLASYFNRNPQSFGKLIGYWVRFRNFFEISLHVLVAALALNWFYYYGLLYWLVAYRYLDVGPRRLFQTLYTPPEKKAARPWAPILNWVVITTIYVLTAIAIYHRMNISRAATRPRSSRTHRCHMGVRSRHRHQRSHRPHRLGHDAQIHRPGPGRTTPNARTSRRIRDYNNPLNQED